jgi:hypothetical protein
MDKLFVDEKELELSKNQYYTEYESRTTLYGQKCKLKDRAFEISFSFNIGLPVLAGPEEAKALYDKLFTILSATGRFIFNPPTREGSRTFVAAFEYTGVGWKRKLNSSLILEYYNNPDSYSVGFLLNRRKN